MVFSGTVVRDGRPGTVVWQKNEHHFGPHPVRRHRLVQVVTARGDRHRADRGSRPFVPPTSNSSSVDVAYAHGRSRGTLRQGLLTRPRGLLPRDRRRRVQDHRPRTRTRPLTRAQDDLDMLPEPKHDSRTGGHPPSALLEPAPLMRPAPAAITLAPPAARPVSLAADGGAVNAAARRRASRGRLLGHSAGRAGSGHGRSLPPVWGLGRRYAGIRHGPARRDAELT